MNVESGWNVGSARKMYADGHLMDSGRILENVASQRLVLSWRSEWIAAFNADGNSTCVFVIEPTGPASKLTLMHSSERPNSKFIGAVAEGWPMVISNLKSLLETGEVALVYHRRHEDSTRRGS